MPKLPADLPENWTQGQTISPNGTEVGLTEQYGYNYLMQQVNATQTEVNSINDTLPDVAQQATVEDINNKIGTEADADTQPTLFGRLAQLKNVLLEKLAELLTKITGIDGKIGTSGDTAGEDTLFGKIGNINKKSTLVPSETLQIDFLNELLSVKDENTMFAGYIYFDSFGVVKVVSHLKKKTGSSTPEIQLCKMVAPSSGNFSVFDSYIERGYTQNNNGLTNFYDLCNLAEAKSTSYQTVTKYVYVQPGLYGIELYGYYGGIDCDSIKFYYDEKDVE